MSTQEQKPGRLYHAASEKCLAGAFVVYSGSSTEEEQAEATTKFQGDGSLASQLIGMGIIARERKQGNDVLIYTHTIDDQINWPDFMGNDYDDSFDEGEDDDGL